MRVSLSKKQAEFLMTYLAEDNKYILDKLLENLSSNTTKISFNITEDIACDIRDWAIEKQQIIGFNKQYKLTMEGEVLQEIIDVFFA